MSTPRTPLGPAPNQEVKELPEGTIPQEEINDVDLNPELYEEAEEEEKVQPSFNEQIVNAEPTASKENSAGPIDKQRSNETSGSVSVEPPVKEPSEPIVLNSITVPFDEKYRLTREELIEGHPESASSMQQSRLINYIDTQLLSIQRKFIKNQASTSEVYLIRDLIFDLLQLIDLIWFSVSTNSRLYGQGDYFTKIMGDLEEYLGHYDLLPETTAGGTFLLVSKQNFNNLLRLFPFFQSLDVKISILIDGYPIHDTGKIEKLTATQQVRVAGITSRLRILIISKLEQIRLILVRTLNDENVDELLRRRAKDYQNTLDIEIGRLFEGLLERA